MLEEILESLKSVESQIDEAERAYANECYELYKQKGFDEYAPKWQKKIRKIADKYATILVSLRADHDELRIEANRLEEAQRKKKYKDTY